ncbi:MAG: transglycosylase family protein [Acidimicrobiales bacterium]
MQPVVVAPVVTTAAPPAAAPAGGVWYELRMCESGGNYAEDTGNGFYGAYQFSLSTWYGLGFTGLPSDASPAVQDRAAEELEAEAGWGQWPGCSEELGL